MPLHREISISVVLCLAVTASAQKPASPDLVLCHGHIFTADTTNPWVEAVAIRGDRILAAGADGAVCSTADAHTQVINLEGRMAMPGIDDSHDHVGGALYGIQVPFPSPPHGQGPDPSIAELAAGVKAAAATDQQNEWIHSVVGPAVIRHPEETKTALNEAGGSHPVMVEAWWGHGVFVNAAGLAKLGIADTITDPEGGRFDRDATGHLTGLMEEEAGNEIRRRLSDEAGVPASVQAFKAYAQRRLAEGVTSVQIMATNQRLSYLERTFVDADTPLRIRIMRFPMAREDERVGEKLKTGEEILSPRVRVAGVKFVLDGTPIEELAYRTKDYADRPGWRGRPDYSVAFIDRQLRIALSGKDQFLFHTAGDAISDEVMDEMEKLAPAATWKPLRVRFEHGDGLDTPERIARAFRLGIVVAQPRPGRPWKSLSEGNIPLAYGSDSGMSPWLIFNVMTDPKNPQAVDRETALRALTIGSSYAEFMENRKGTIKPGALADITVLSQDVSAPTAAPVMATHSVLTIVGGKIAFQSPGPQ
ncbi:amidohydrolase [Granulicella sibirica]|uniref:Exoenzymes regulatory protein AepA n=1 Tax=Granulicella sibirica TaxID=2479048 RepID=A0A4Q0T1D4_9BACT|nr:amidohydrolase family protein [Granulicella sibirica]RXH57383.1 Exoenzymes regulatory protein AepA precursor [Granulicella sibirica]